MGRPPAGRRGQDLGRGGAEVFEERGVGGYVLETFALEGAHFRGTFLGGRHSVRDCGLLGGWYGARGIERIEKVGVGGFDFVVDEVIHFTRDGRVLGGETRAFLTVPQGSTVME